MFFSGWNLRGGIESEVQSRRLDLCKSRERALCCPDRQPFPRFDHGDEFAAAPVVVRREHVEEGAEGRATPVVVVYTWHATVVVPMIGGAVFYCVILLLCPRRA